MDKVGSQFVCKKTGRTFIRTGEYRYPEYKEYYETYYGYDITSQADKKYYTTKFHICKPKFPGKDK